MFLRRMLVWRGCGRRWPLAAAAWIAGAASAQTLPPEIDAALQRAQLPRDAVTLLVVDASGKAPPRLAHRTQVPVNPASVMKLVTTYAALDRLGPGFTWSTPVYAEGAVRDGTLYGNLYLRGQGDPKLVAERLWLLLRRVQGLGVRHIAGDIVLDSSAFALPPQDPAAFDGEPLQPYNATPDALLVNYKSLSLTFVPDRSANLAAVHLEPALAGVAVPASVPLLPGECGDWRTALKGQFNDATQIRFAGGLPAACGERTWYLAAPDPSGFAARAVAGTWAQLGGTLAGRVRPGTVPAGLAQVFEWPSPPLTEVVRDINKYSNNVMAQQVFLTLGRQPGGRTSPESARDALAQWWRERLGGVEPPVLDNGSGLSRHERITAQALASLLQLAWASGLMPELMASLPSAGADGTLRRARNTYAAHLKTGSLRDVTGVAGYVHAAQGRRYVLVAIANHPTRAMAMRPVIEALIDWTAREAP